MPRKHSSQSDPVEAEIERALDPGTFIPDRACYSLVNDLEMVAARIGKLTVGDPARAVILITAQINAEKVADKRRKVEGPRARGAKYLPGWGTGRIRNVFLLFPG